MPTTASDRDNRALALINTLSSTLLNIDAEYEFEIRRIRAMKATARDHRDFVLERLRMRHDERREPYIRNIAELRGRIGTHG